MTVKIQIDHTYSEPVELVAATHLAKYPNKYDSNVIACDIIEKRTSGIGCSYTRRIATCKNVLPYLLRKISSLNVDEVKLEEECEWHRNARTLSVSSRNITWAGWITMEESSTYKPHHMNENWTLFNQEGTITVNGLGRFGSILEMFGKRFLTYGAHRSIKVTEMLMAEREHTYFEKCFMFWYSQFIAG